jgi:hypothetical protein
VAGDLAEGPLVDLAGDPAGRPVVGAAVRAAIVGVDPLAHPVATSAATSAATSVDESGAVTAGVTEVLTETAGAGPVGLPGPSRTGGTRRSLARGVPSRPSRGCPTMSAPPTSTAPCGLSCGP